MLREKNYPHSPPHPTPAVLFLFFYITGSVLLLHAHLLSQLLHPVTHKKPLPSCPLLFFSYSFCGCPPLNFSFALSAPALLPLLLLLAFISHFFSIRLSPFSSPFCRLHLPLFALPSYFPLSDPSLNNPTPPPPHPPPSEAVCDCNVCKENTECQPESDR